MNEKSTTSDVFCRSCGKVNPAGMRFCGFCGNPIQKEEPSKGDNGTTQKGTSVLQFAEAEPKAGAVSRPGSPPTVVPTSVSAKPSRPMALSPEQERERERLISQATAFRVKGQITDARLTLQKALEFADTMTPQAQAPLFEQLGDLLQTEDMYDESLAAYARALELDPRRVSADRKHAEAALQKARASGKLSVNAALMRGDSVAELLVSGELGGNRGKRNAGMAMFLSMIVPGFGQFYNGEIIKAIILVGAFTISLLVLSLSPEKNVLFKDIVAVFALQGQRASFGISPLTTFFALVCVGTWLYSIVDAPFSAGKSGEIRSDGPIVDKSGWEV